MGNGKGSKLSHMVSVPNTSLEYPQTVITGAHSGASICITAGVHSREYVGIEAVNRLAARLNPDCIHGSVRFIHALNYAGLIERSADVFPCDGRNLNREFPGDPSGSETQRLAVYLEREVTGQADYLIDLHSGGGYEHLTPHVYFHGSAAPDICAVSERMARYALVKCIVRSTAENGLYSHAGQLGTPAILLERGGCGLWSDAEVEDDIADVMNIMRMLGILCDGAAPIDRNPRVLPGGYYLESPASGLWYPFKHVGDDIQKGELLAEIRSPFGQLISEMRAICDGVILYQTASLGIEAGKSAIAYGIAE